MHELRGFLKRPRSLKKAEEFVHYLEEFMHIFIVLEQRILNAN
jgi:hypothetical protein